ncbi:GNAT family N-acetyltransferase [Paenibacillus lutrae]|uniref:GNAT family N-acetyltransferase n=1 Tax=Paenibacillus lutrae TaxID=2078573 RepID=A0A7X3K178_9BACL|nr:GNAT family N-acetyltransferase [Paenibacillus lutrae]MVP01867.1 GNAT family N-acetyltransferase [Paenibacillus lutrae]
MQTSLTIVIRRAQWSDIPRLIELRKLLLSQGNGHYVSRTEEDEEAWQSSYRQWLTTHLHGNPNILIAVAGEKDSSDSAACAIGIIDERAPMKGCLNGRVGWIQTVVVDPGQRRKGYAESIMQYILNWFHEKEVGKVVLQTTEIAKSLYTKLGFAESGEDLLIKSIS